MTKDEASNRMAQLHYRIKAVLSIQDQEIIRDELLAVWKLGVNHGKCEERCHGPQPRPYTIVKHPSEGDGKRVWTML